MPGLTPEEISAAIRDPNSGAMPVQIAVYCDGCMRTAIHDYLVRVEATKRERLEAARDHMRRKDGWQCDEHGDFCPACRTDPPKEGHDHG